MSITQDRNKRLREIVWKVGIVFLVGLLYWMLYRNLGFHIPCLFNVVTGFLCPGCGITSMCSYLLILDFKGAFLSNPGVLISLPVLACFIGSILLKYIKSGRYELSKLQHVIAVVLLFFYIAYAILRNLNI